jgi:hypothetical protein
MLGAMQAARGLVARLSVARTVGILAALAPAACGRIGFGDGGGGPPDGSPAADAGAPPADTAAPADTPAAACRANPAYAPIGQSAHAYRAVDGNAAWATAKASCEVEGAYLAILDDAAELAIFPGNGWIGVTDAATEGVWLTLRGDPAPFLPWQAGEPNGGTEENCARFDDGPRQLESRRCTDLREWTCECD